MMRWLLFALACLPAHLKAADQPGPLEVLETVAQFSQAELAEVSRGEPVRRHLIGLGAMQKVRGVWRPDESVRLSGTLSRFTWRALDSFPSEVLLEDVESDLGAVMTLEPLFSCEARACGDSAQWANRIFAQRVLYGRADSQRYRVYSVSQGGAEYRVMLYASARTSDRQYLHAEVLELDAGDQ